MTTLRDIARRGVVTALAALAKKEPLNAGEFTTATGYTSKTAEGLRKEMLNMGLITVTVIHVRGGADRLEIRLTPLGKDLAKHASAMEDTLQKWKRKAQR